MQTPVREINIVLIGFMGAGKSTIGELVAQRLGRSFIDTDQEIERQSKMPITQIFEELGETKFREMERNLIIDLCQNSRLHVIALGGGAYMQEAIREACLSHCMVFFLDISWDTWKDRMSLLIDNRPVLQNKSLAEIEQLFETRRNIYALNSIKIPTDHLNVEEVADYIVESLKRAWD